MSFDAAAVSGQLAARGLRLTRQRRAVLDAIAGAPSSLSALQVYDAAREGCPELGLTTVYRTLEVLTEIGALRRVHGPDHCESFVPASAGSDSMSQRTGGFCMGRPVSSRVRIEARSNRNPSTCISSTQ